MDITELLPGDVLFFKADNWLWKLFVHYRHVALFYEWTKRGLPLIAESAAGRVGIHCLLQYAGETITVKRINDLVLGQAVADAGEHLVDRPESWYDYFSIPRFVLPKLILAKIGHLLPERWRLAIWLLAKSYGRNGLYICSELVASAFKDAGCAIINEETIPLPDDLFASPTLILAGDLMIPGGNNA